MFSRRGFIRMGAASLGSLALRPLGLLPALAQSSSDYRALVCVFLQGGNDSNNMIVPMDSASYNSYLAARGNLALSGSALTGIVEARTGQRPYAFHAGLAEMASLFSANQLAVVANVGTLVQPTTRAQYQNQSVPLPVNLFSHSDQQAQWQTCALNGPGATGWAGRTADLVSHLNTSAFPAFLSTAGNAVMGVGAQTRPVVLSPGQSLALPGASAPYAGLQSLLTLNTGITLAQAANATVASSVADAQSLGNTLAQAAPLTTRFPATCLGAQLAQVAQVIQMRGSIGMSRQIFFCALGGFDTHASQIAVHSSLYPQMSQALFAFQSALGELGVQNNVTTFTASEFSRTFQPTTGNGTDHGWGGHQFVLGGAVAGGDVYGAFPNFELGGPDDADVRGRWIPKVSVDQYGATLSSWFGVPDASLQAVFPNVANFSPQKLSFLN